jgi:hypothetical protein
MKKQTVKVELSVNGVGLFEARETGRYGGFGKALAVVADDWAKGQDDSKTPIEERLKEILAGFMSVMKPQSKTKKSRK